MQEVIRIIIRTLILWVVLIVIGFVLSNSTDDWFNIIWSSGCIALLFGVFVDTGLGDGLTITQKNDAAVARYGWNVPQVDPAQKLAEDTFPTDRKSD